MEQLEKIKKLNLAKLPPTKRMKVFKILLFSSAVTLIIMNFSSLGMTGSNFIVWKEMQTESIEKIMMEQHSTYFSSQQFIIAFDVLCLFMTIMLVFSVFKFYTKGNLIILTLSIIFWALRWSASIFFLSTDSALQEENDKKLSLIYDDNGKMNSLCRAEQCTGELLNYVECGKILLWRQTYHFQIIYLVITILVGGLLFMVSYKTNKLDVGLGQSEHQLSETS